MWVIRYLSEHDYEVGFYGRFGRWECLSSFTNMAEAVQACHYLNGGCSPQDPDEAPWWSL